MQKFKYFWKTKIMQIFHSALSFRMDPSITTESGTSEFKELFKEPPLI